jgi:hypothetical protein
VKAGSRKFWSGAGGGGGRWADGGVGFAVGFGWTVEVALLVALIRVTGDAAFLLAEAAAERIMGPTRWPRRSP